MNPAKYDITVYKGATFLLMLTHRSNGAPTDLTGYSVILRLKRDEKTTTPVDAFFKASTADATITVNALGEIVVLISATDTAQITSIGEGVWGIDLTAPDGFVVPLLRGIASIKQSIMV